MLVIFAETEPIADDEGTTPAPPPLLAYSERRAGFVQPNIEKITECDVGTSRIDVKSKGELVIWTIDRTLLESFLSFSKLIRPSITVSHDSFVKYKSFWHIGKNGIIGG